MEKTRVQLYVGRKQDISDNNSTGRKENNGSLHRLKYILFILVICTTKGFAQQSYKQVDSMTYRMYLNKEWDKLSRFGKDAANESYDYYYFNLRVGIAYYNLKEYKKAEGYFKKALANNTDSDIAGKYLFWCNIYLNDEGEAYDLYRSLPESTRQKIDYEPKRIIDYVFVEGGNKFSNDLNAAGNLMYANIGLYHKFSPKFGIYHSYTYLRQKQAWGEFEQHQYYISPSYKLPGRWRVDLGFHYA